ncbi:MAG: sigma-70 family RNA polymerase sigma factor [Planctomycetales bacterium]|nr:sigma-70 family RNA polymerase sigma factor [Planctomycetales bacterium]
MENRQEKSENQSDSSLLGRMQRGESEAAYSIYVRYAERLLELARRQTGRELSSRMDAEDIVQSVFRTFFRRASAGQYEIPEGDVLWKLLLVIALNKIRSQASHHRAAKRDVGRTQSLPDAGLHAELESCDAEKVLQMCIDDLLEDLPEASQQAIRMRIEGYEVSEIAEKTKRSKRTVERVLHAFRAKLQESSVLSEELA